MIDWHSHILPEMDDGSQSVHESESMLESLKSQGATCVIATPHFLANEESVEDFLMRRRASYEMLMRNRDCGQLRVICGAEVKYYPGIAKMKDLEKLAIENTKFLLLEMPMTRWTEYTVKELIELAGVRGLTIIMAHIERYLNLQAKGTIERLYENGLLMQVNASFFERIGSRRKALRMLGSGMIHFIGSDCHNMTTRPPRLDSAYSIIEKNFGEYYISQMNEFGYHALGRQ